MSVENLPPLRDVLRAHGLEPKKALGQNFLLDLNLTARVARGAGDLRDATVVEVGPGPGGLTRALLQQPLKRLIAIEKDERCLAALAEVQAVDPRLTVINADALTVDLKELAGGPVHIAANLPYNVATPLTVGWLKVMHEQPGAVSGMTLMYQREVAQRLSAEPGGKTWGRLGVIAQWLCDVQKLFDISPQAFTPPPKVVSSVVSFTPRSKPLFDAGFDEVEQLTAAIFGQRRKMLRQSLKGFRADAQAVLDSAGIDGTKRAEELTLQEIGALLKAGR